MNAVEERRNNPLYWQTPVKWTSLTTRTRPRCDDCVIHQHETHGATPVRVDKAVARRRAGAEAAGVMVLCKTHRDEWMNWTPGQLVLP